MGHQGRQSNYLNVGLWGVGLGGAVSFVCKNKSKHQVVAVMKYIFNSRVGYRGLQLALGVGNRPFLCSCNSLTQVLQ